MPTNPEPDSGIATGSAAGNGRAVSLDDIRSRLRRLERQDWCSNWYRRATVLVMLLLTFAIFSLSFPGILHEDNPFYWFDLDTAVRGLFGLVLLFSVSVVYQQVLIKRLRQQLATQLAEMAALESRAEIFERLAVIDPLIAANQHRHLRILAHES